MTISRKKTVCVSAVLALPPLVLTMALVGHLHSSHEIVPAVAVYNEPPADPAAQKPKSFVRLFAALRDDATGR